MFIVEAAAEEPAARLAAAGWEMATDTAADRWDLELAAAVPAE